MVIPPEAQAAIDTLVGDRKPYKSMKWRKGILTGLTHPITLCDNYGNELVCPGFRVVVNTNIDRLNDGFDGYRMVTVEGIGEAAGSYRIHPHVYGTNRRPCWGRMIELVNHYGNNGQYTELMLLTAQFLATDVIDRNANTVASLSWFGSQYDDYIFRSYLEVGHTVREGNAL